MNHIKFSGKRLAINSEHVIDFKYPVKDAFETGKTVVVFLDPDSCPMTGLYSNLWVFDLRGRKLWEAELPSNSRFDIWKRKGPVSEKSDIYWGLQQKEPLIASSFSSYDCEIDLATGEIIKADFYK